MSDVTSQAFREAAEAERQKSHGIGLTYVVELLLAAAEQREQCDQVMADYEELVGVRTKLLDVTADRETLELKLAACTAAALGNTDTTVQERIETGHPYYSATYGDVCRAVDREMDLRAETVGLKTIVELLREQIATLTAEHDKWVLGAAAMSHEHGELQAQIAVLTKENRTLTSRVNGLRRTLDNDPAGAAKRLQNLASAFSTCDLCEGPCEDESSPNILCGACLATFREQIATLTAERDEARAKMAEWHAKIITSRDALKADILYGKEVLP